MLDQVQPGEDCDLVSDFAFHVPVAIIGSRRMIWAATGWVAPGGDSSRD